MKTDTAVLKLLFIVNPGSGSNDTDFKTIITEFFKGQDHQFEIYELPEKCSKHDISTAIKKAKADRVVAVGGDGTLKLVAEALKGTKTPIGIIPAGSANGMARELGIPLGVNEALGVAVNGTTQ